MTPGKNKWIQYSNLGFQIIATLGLFGGIGYFLDNRYPESSPYFLIGLLLVGVGVTLYHLWKTIFK
tara:strand:+ start:144 stop:341 length:198 start_codon:yes stop_codon:yes gene_type:complete